MKDKIRELTISLNYYRDKYYNEHISEISDWEYDMLYDRLVTLEQATGFILPDSPTKTIGYQVKSTLKKVKHNHPMLSLDKTQDLNTIKSFVGNKEWIAMLKLDGLTCSLLYENGRLVRAETRGDGEVGEDVTHNAMVIPSIPKQIEYTGRLVVDGEIICKLDDFKEFAAEYKNARNFASGSIRLLDSAECAKRKLTFVAWDVIGKPKSHSLWSVLDFISDLSFTVVPFLRSRHCSVEDILCLRELATAENYPIDGLVIKLDNCVEYDAMGRTEHHFRGGMAYKFYDESYKTTLIDLEFTMGKTGTLTPTAVFKPIEIDGTTVERASVHNISILTKLDLHIGDTIEVYKAHQIIPQVKRNISADERIALGLEPDYIIIPSICPVCGGDTEIKQDNDTKVLICTNNDCKGKLLGKLTHFVSKNAINIEGMSEATIEKFIELGWLNDFESIYSLKDHYDEMIHLEGFGEKSVKKLLNSIEKSKNTTLNRFIYALSIPLIGRSASRTIAKYFDGDFNDFFADKVIHYFDWTKLNDFGEAMSNSMNGYIRYNETKIWSLSTYFNFEKPQTTSDSASLSGKTFVITGALEYFANRDEAKEKIEQLGGKVVGTVSKKCSYLITNEASGSSKYKKAIELNIPIITEIEFLKMCEE